MREIQLTKGKIAIIDDCDYDFLIQWTWHATFNRRTWYARSSDGNCFQMSRLIVGALPSEKVDHWDHNGLNNQRYNLRVCNNSQNCANKRVPSNNTSGFKGVHRVGNRWRARIGWQQNGVQLKKCLGIYDSPQQAAAEYDFAAVMLWGEFALTNAALGLL